MKKLRLIHEAFFILVVNFFKAKSVLMKILHFIIICFFIWIGCTPKATQPVSEVVSEEKEKIEIGPCADWFETGQQDYAETEHVLYRDALKAGKYEEAYTHWKNVFAIAPMADGKRRTHFTCFLRPSGL